MQSDTVEERQPILKLPRLHATQNTCVCSGAVISAFNVPMLAEQGKSLLGALLVYGVGVHGLAETVALSS